VLQPTAPTRAPYVNLFLAVFTSRPDSLLATKKAAVSFFIAPYDLA
jgi:hypothetical protein